MPRHKISIYQSLVRLFANPSKTNQPHGSLSTNGSGHMSGYTMEVLHSLHGLGITHMWYTGLIRHATRSTFEGIPADHPDVVKGEAGSPYAITDYYDIAPSIADDLDHRHAEFDALVQRTHSAGMGVIIDYVPNHLSRTYHSIMAPQGTIDFGALDRKDTPFDPDNNYYYLPGEELELPTIPSSSSTSDQQTRTASTPYQEYPARATGNDVFGAHPSAYDWYETVKLNYGYDYRDGSAHYSPIPRTWHMMYDVLRYWASRGVDGFRCDMAEMVPIPYWRWCIQQLRSEYPSLLFVAEVYNPNQYEAYISAGFDYLYDKVGLYDALHAIVRDQCSTVTLSPIGQRPNTLTDHLLHFVENHDEVRMASPFGAGSALRAFPAMALSALIDRGGILTYFGQELGEEGMDAEGYSGLDGRTSIFDYWGIDTVQRWIESITAIDADMQLTREEVELRVRYQQLLQISTTTAAIVHGQSFDLMYANPSLPDRDSLYAFMRSYEHEVAIIVVNFGPSPHHLQLHIPQHAFELLSIQGGPCTIESLTTGGKRADDLRPDHPHAIDVAPYSYTIHYTHLP